MNKGTPDNQCFGLSFPGPLARVALCFLLPTRRREELVGDLIEEAETVILPTSGQQRARRWFWRQVLTSASPLYARRAAKEAQMLRWRWMFIVVLLIAGLLMALDASVFTAAPGVLCLVAMAIFVPAATGLISGNLRVLAGSAIASAILLLVARLTSGIEIRWYAMAFIFFVILNLGRVVEKPIGKQTTT